MEQIIRGAVERGASDIHIRGGEVVRARIGGKLLPLTKQKLSPEQARAFVLTVIASPTLRERIDLIQDHDCSWGVHGVGRFRVNVMRQRGSFVVCCASSPTRSPRWRSWASPRWFQRLPWPSAG